MSKFKVGDTVRCINADGRSCLAVGQTYTVMETGFPGLVCVPDAVGLFWYKEDAFEHVSDQSAPPAPANATANAPTIEDLFRQIARVEQENQALTARNTSLLEANSREVERRRQAEAKLRALKELLAA